MREMDRLIANLFPEEGPRLVDLKFFPGEQPVTVEEFCKDVHAALVQIDAQQTDVGTSYIEHLKVTTLDCFLSAA